MARNNQDTYASYQRDEFDNPPQGPVGAHRGKTSLASRIMPYFIVVIVAALVGALAWGVYSGEASHIRMPWSTSASSSAPKAKSAAPSAKDKTDTDKTDTPSTSASPSQKDSESPEASSSPSSSALQQTVNKNTAIVVTNATSISGHAAQRASALTQNGYASVSSRNASGQIPSATVVMYQNEVDKATAQDVANTLGISLVEQVPTIAGPVVVVLLD